MKKNIPKPHRIARWLLCIMANRKDNAAIIGDLEEEFHRNIDSHGITFARLSYWLVAIISFPSFFTNFVYWRMIMIRNYIKMAAHRKKYSLIQPAHEKCQTGTSYSQKALVTIQRW